jgi:hypothetical protein
MTETGTRPDLDVLTLLDLEWDFTPRCEHAQHYRGRNGHSDHEDRFYLVLVWPHCGPTMNIVMCASYIDHMIVTDGSVRCIGCGKGGLAAREAYRVISEL